MANVAIACGALPVSSTAPAVDSRLTEICALGEIPVLGARVIERPGHPDGNVALFRTADDRVFAVLDRCPHRGGPLSQGIVYGDRVACPLHNWSIELASGHAVAPDSGCARTFAVQMQQGVVYAALG
jgi:nitrite reductase (NADH) small subunit